jgi:hypothetical protein
MGEGRRAKMNLTEYTSKPLKRKKRIRKYLRKFFWFMKADLRAYRIGEFVEHREYLALEEF